MSRRSSPKAPTRRELAAAVTSEIGRLFGAQRATPCAGRATRSARSATGASTPTSPVDVGRVYPFGGDTVIARVVESGAPVRLDSPADLRTEFARERWAEFGFQAALGAPIAVAGEIWGGVVAFRTRPDDPFPPGLEHRLGNFAALVAQAIFNAEARREAAELVNEQSALREIATLVAAGRPQAEVLEAVTVHGRPAVRRDTACTPCARDGGADELVVVAAWSDADRRPRRAGLVVRRRPRAADARPCSRPGSRAAPTSCRQNAARARLSARR